MIQPEFGSGEKLLSICTAADASVSVVSDDSSSFLRFSRYDNAGNPVFFNKYPKKLKTLFSLQNYFSVSGCSVRLPAKLTRDSAMRISSRI